MHLVCQYKVKLKIAFDTLHACVYLHQRVTCYNVVHYSLSYPLILGSH